MTPGPKRIKRRIVVVGDIAYVPLTKGAVALIDASDADWAAQYNWCRTSSGYPVRRIRRYGKFYLLSMHRALLGLIAHEVEGDHINGDPLDNRRSNLRVVSHAQNLKNLKTRVNNSSGVPGVVWDKSRALWQVRIVVDGRTIYGGRFADFDDAVATRKQLEAAHFGALARQVQVGETTRTNQH